MFLIHRNSILYILNVTVQGIIVGVITKLEPEAQFLKHSLTFPESANLGASPIL